LVTARCAILVGFRCSPTITAGISFEKEHFTRVVGFARNAGEFGATIDCFVQQLGRVRNLGDAGELHIYVIDPPKQRIDAGPVDGAELDGVLKVRFHCWRGGVEIQLLWPHLGFFRLEIQLLLLCNRGGERGSGGLATRPEWQELGGVLHHLGFFRLEIQLLLLCSRGG
jgi:hypothetical protein